MNTPTEPEGGKLGPGNIKITLLASSGQAWTGGVIEHNGKKYRIGKDGSMILAVNGGEIYANGFTVTRIIREQVKKGVSEIFLQHDSWNSRIIKIEE